MAVFVKISLGRRRRRHFRKSFLTKILDARTNWVGRVNLRKQGFHMVWVSHACDAPKIGICDFGPFSETYFAEILGVRKNWPPMTHSRHPAFRWYRFGLCVMKTVGGVTRTKWEKSVPDRRTDGQTDRQTNRKQYPLFTGDKDTDRDRMCAADYTADKNPNNPLHCKILSRMFL